MGWRDPKGPHQHPEATNTLKVHNALAGNVSIEASRSWDWDWRQGAGIGMLTGGFLQQN